MDDTVSLQKYYITLHEHTIWWARGGQDSTRSAIYRNSRISREITSIGRNYQTRYSYSHKQFLREDQIIFLNFS